ncbi:phage tail protein [Streptomyces sp. NPDC058579]|uniref:phage tail protein n=1 Tax=Streptomyces sp. NPDC058579 TaxID=3346548 RepID=UPI00365C7CD9
MASAKESAPDHKGLFGLQVDGIEIPNAISVSGLEKGTGIVEETVIDTKTGLPFKRKTPGTRTAPVVTLVRPADDKSKVLIDWVKAAETGDTGKMYKNATIEAKDPSGKTTKRYNLTDAWVSSYKVDDFSAGSDGAATETVTIQCTTLEIE